MRHCRCPTGLWCCNRQFRRIISGTFNRLEAVQRFVMLQQVLKVCETATGGSEDCDAAKSSSDECEVVRRLRGLWCCNR